MTRYKYAGGLASLALLAGCSGLVGGPCSHTYRDPLLTIATATNSASGVGVARLLLAEFRVNGQPAQPQMVILGDQSERVTLADEVVICDVACAFGTSEGRYEFTVSAPGYRTAAVQVEARYPRFKGGCPSYNAGTNRLDVRLAPQ